MAKKKTNKIEKEEEKTLVDIGDSDLDSTEDLEDIEDLDELEDLEDLEDDTDDDLDDLDDDDEDDDVDDDDDEDEDDEDDEDEDDEDEDDEDEDDVDEDDVDGDDEEGDDEEESEEDGVGDNTDETKVADAHNPAGPMNVVKYGQRVTINIRGTEHIAIEAGVELSCSPGDEDVAFDAAKEIVRAQIAEDVEEVKKLKKG